MFINRKKELSELKKRYDSSKFELIILYGRRRVGKSRLILESIKSRSNSVYFLAMEQDEKLNLLNFKENLAKTLNDDTITSLVDDWELVFKHIAKKANIIVIDEFPYLLSMNQKIKSVFQRIIDLHLVNTEMTLVLMGSSISMMVNEVLSAKSPLYGRRTSQMRLHPLKLIHLKYFFPGYSFEDLIQTYAVIGGVPYYLNQFVKDKSLWENISENILDVYSVLFAEGEFLLRQEFSKISTYTSILQQIASGRTEINEIKNQLSIQGDISSYLNNLKELDLIEKRIPLLEDPIKSRRGRYYLKDHYLNFWFRFVFPNQHDILSEEKTEAMEHIKQKFSNYMGKMFESIVQEIFEFLILSSKVELPFKPKKLAKWWYKDIEFDLVGKKDDQLLFIEIKWKDLTDIDIARIFSNVAKKVEKTNFSGNMFYLIIAKKVSLIKYQLKQNQLLWDLSTIEKWITDY